MVVRGICCKGEDIQRPVNQNRSRKRESRTGSLMMEKGQYTSTNQESFLLANKTEYHPYTIQISEATSYDESDTFGLVPYGNDTDNTNSLHVHFQSGSYKSNGSMSSLSVSSAVSESTYMSTPQTKHYMSTSPDNNLTSDTTNEHIGISRDQPDQQVNGTSEESMMNRENDRKFTKRRAIRAKRKSRRSRSPNCIHPITPHDNESGHEVLTPRKIQLNELRIPVSDLRVEDL